MWSVLLVDLLINLKLENVSWMECQNFRCADSAGYEDMQSWHQNGKYLCISTDVYCTWVRPELSWWWTPYEDLFCSQHFPSICHISTAHETCHQAHICFLQTSLSAHRLLEWRSWPIRWEDCGHLSQSSVDWLLLQYSIIMAAIRSFYYSKRWGISILCL